MLLKFYNSIIFLIILLCSHQVCYSNGRSSYKDLVYLKNYYFNNFLSSEFGRYKRQSTNNEKFCEFPKETLHTKYKILAKSERSYKPGEYAETASVLEVNCDEGYNFVSRIAPKYSICVNGKWNPSPTTCSRSCPPLISTETTTVKCTYKHVRLDDCLNPVDETSVILSCAPFYEEANLARNPFRICRNGRWNPSIAECYPSCGMKTPKGVTNIINGRTATRGDYPWQVGVYKANKVLICGGSIISRNVILSAAHCFADNYGNTYPPENYYIAAGKYYREYNDERDDLGQYSKVLAIHIPERYKSINHFFGNDIAVIALSDPFTFSLVVQPTCIELNEKTYSLNLYLNATGIVTGWGYTKEGSELSEVLRELEIPFVPYLTCYNAVPEIYRQFITNDKICGGYIKQGRSVCGGDSGGALVFKNVADNRYYAIGIVSTSPITDELVCDSNSYSLYTNISLHNNFMGTYIQYYNADKPVECKSKDDCINGELQNINSCPFPNAPLNGKFIFVHQNQNITYAPGDYIPMGSIVSLSCDVGYEVSSPSETQFYCGKEEQWMPTLGICKKLNAEPDTCSVIGEEGSGTCTSIRNCKPIVSYLEIAPSTSKEIALEKYQCGYEEYIPKVCCYANKSIEISISDTEDFQEEELPYWKNSKLLSLQGSSFG